MIIVDKAFANNFFSRYKFFLKYIISRVMFGYLFYLLMKVYLSHCLSWWDSQIICTHTVGDTFFTLQVWILHFIFLYWIQKASILNRVLPPDWEISWKNTKPGYCWSCVRHCIYARGHETTGWTEPNIKCAKILQGYVSIKT